MLFHNYISLYHNDLQGWSGHPYTKRWVGELIPLPINGFAEPPASDNFPLFGTTEPNVCRILGASPLGTTQGEQFLSDDVQHPQLFLQSPLVEQWLVTINVVSLAERDGLFRDYHPGLRCLGIFHTLGNLTGCLSDV